MDIIFENINYIALGTAAVALILLIVLIVVIAKQVTLTKKYNSFMEGSNGKTLEEEILRRFGEIDSLKDSQIKIGKQIDQIKETLLSTYQKLGIVKYDAFQEMGGKLSFAMCMLDDENDGFIINSMHSSREGCYTYVKEIIKGKSFVELSAEERQSLERAMKSNDFMG